VLTTDQGQVKITGALEGHVAGTSVVVRGAFKETAYGKQLDCSSIVVDSVSGELTVIRSWARKVCAEFAEDIVALMRAKPIDERWAALCDPVQLVCRSIGEDEAKTIARYAKNYLALIVAKKGLMEKGFTDNEAEKLCARYGGYVEQKVEEDPYGIVIDRTLGFNRVDVVVNGRIVRNDPRRLGAAMVQALKAAGSNGHTAATAAWVQKEAAAMAGVYVEAVRSTKLPAEIVASETVLQLRGVASAEISIAKWIAAAARRL
jgi:hypothetical protein